MSEELTPKQALFCHEYVSDPKVSPREAAIRAGYNASNATQQSDILMSIPAVQKKIKELNDTKYQIDGFHKTEVIRELIKIAHSDISDYFKEDYLGRLVLKHDAGKIRNAGAVKSLKSYVTGDVELTLWDKNKALESLGKYFKILTEHTETSVTVKNAYDLTKLSDEELEALRVLQEKMER